MLVLVSIAHATCPNDAGPRIERLARAVEAAYDAVDDEAFQAATAALDEAVPCVRSELSGDALLAWHRARALQESWERELVASSKSWAAVRALDPAYSPPEAWLPEGSALRRAWEEAPTGSERIKLERVPEGGWRVDGQPTPYVPTERGFVLQGFDTSGQLVHTDYHYSVAEVPVVDFAALDPTAQQLRRRRMHAGGSALAATLATSAIAVVGVAAGQRTSVFDPAVPVGALDGHAGRANRLSNTAVALGLASGATLAATWAIPW